MNILKNWKPKAKLKERHFTFIVFLLITANVFSQRTLSLQTIIDSSLVNNPSIKASNATVKQQQHLVKSAINLPSPEILLQNPTGNFYTVGAQQSFDFPTVYGSQRKIQKENVKLAEIAKNRSLADLKYQISILYSELRFGQQSLQLLQQQDSIYTIIATNADRSFKAGTIDYIQFSFAKLQAGQVKTNLFVAQANYASILQSIKTISGIKSDFLTDNKEAEILLKTDANIDQNINLLFAKQEIIISEKRLQLERQKILPGFNIGFINAGEKDTPFKNQLFAGLRIPLWFWQYKGNINAAKSQIEVSKFNSENEILRTKTELQSAQSKNTAYKKALDFYKSDASKLATSLIDASNRFYKSGNYSVTEYLRNLNDAADIQKDYLEIQKNYNQSIIYIQYLTGNL
ncbi:MAG: TolC family protein [Flavobacterium sp.]